MESVTSDTRGPRRSAKRAPANGATKRNAKDASATRAAKRNANAPPDTPGTDTGANDLTIEQLAGAVGMTVRNIRNHHTRGLLPAPEVRARIGYYNAEHVARLRLIQDLQADGFNLAAIERLLGSSDGLAGRLLGLRRAVTTPFEPETPEVFTAEELEQRFGPAEARDTELVGKLRLLLPLGEGRFEAPSPSLLAAAEQVMALGIPLRTTLLLVEKMSRDCDSVSRAFTKLFLKEVWEPFQKAGSPDEGWDELIENIDSLRPLASEALLALFKLRMTTQLEDAFGKVIEHQAKRR
jgi:DNA-binding transcriptional MerR regulator